MIRTLAVLVMLAGTFLFGISYHAVDLATNFINQGIGSDVNAIGRVSSSADIYMSGMKGLLVSVGMLISGFTLLYSNGDVKKWRGKQC